MVDREKTRHIRSEWKVVNRGLINFSFRQWKSGLSRFSTVVDREKKNVVRLSSYPSVETKVDNRGFNEKDGLYPFGTEG